MNFLKPILLSSLLIHSISGEGQTLYNRDNIGTTFTHFYLHPDSATLCLLILSIQENQEAREALPSAPVVGFFSAILLSDSRNQKIVKRQLLGLRERFDLFSFALQFGKTQDTIYNWTSRRPDTNDLYWGAFYGTGDTRYLDKLINETQFLDRQDSIGVYMAAASAQWSLCTNARQHEAVKKHLLQRTATADERTKKVLLDIIARDPSLIRNEILRKVTEMKEKTKE